MALFCLRLSAFSDRAYPDPNVRTKNISETKPKMMFGLSVLHNSELLATTKY